MAMKTTPEAFEAAVERNEARRLAHRLAKALRWVEHECPPSRHGCTACEALESYEKKAAAWR